MALPVAPVHVLVEVDAPDVVFIQEHGDEVASRGLQDADQD
jgi:hypothetical protein